MTLNGHKESGDDFTTLATPAPQESSTRSKKCRHLAKRVRSCPIPGCTTVNVK